MYKKNSLKNLFLFLLSVNVGFQAIGMQRYAGGPATSGEDDPIRADFSYGASDIENRMRTLIFEKEVKEWESDLTAVSSSLDQAHKQRFLNEIIQTSGSRDCFPTIEEMRLIAARTKPFLKKEQKADTKVVQQNPSSFVNQNLNSFVPNEPVFLNPVVVDYQDQVVDGIIVIINTAKKLPSFIRRVASFGFPTEKVLGLALFAHLIKNMF